jgi:hypothetical protein
MAVILRVRTIVANGVITPFAFLHGKPVAQTSAEAPREPATGKEPGSP